MKKILIFNDCVSWGRIGGSQLDTILTYKGIDVLFLPTALISNMFSMGEISIMDTSQYLENVLNKWTKLDIIFDAIFIGYIKSFEQKDLIEKFIKSLPYKPLVVHDPIMADKGSLYKGLDPNIVDIHKEISKLSNIIIPNFTEAYFLTGKKTKNIRKIIEDLSDNKRKVIVTSAKDYNSHNIIAYDKGKFEKISYNHIDKTFAGTGDIFDGIFLANYLSKGNFFESIKKSKDSISKILETKVKEDDGRIDIRIEKYFNFI